MIVDEKTRQSSKSVDEITVGKMCLDKMTVDQMAVDKMNWLYKRCLWAK